MDIGLLIILLACSPIVIIAIVLMTGRGAFLIAGYNTMGKKNQAAYNTKAMCRFVGRLLLGFIIFLLIGFIGVHFDIALFKLGFAASFLTLVLGIIYANTGNRFRKPPDQ